MKFHNLILTFKNLLICFINTIKSYYFLLEMNNMSLNITKFQIKIRRKNLMKKSTVKAPSDQ